MQLTQSQLGEVVTLVRDACVSQARALGGCQIDPDTGIGPVFEKIWDNLTRLDQVHLLPNYVRRTARWEARRFFLQSVKRSPVLQGDEGTAPSAFEEVAAKEELALIAKVLARLPPRWREALLVTAGAQDFLAVPLTSAKTVTELADRWRCSRQHIYDLKDKAIRWIRHHIDRKWGEHHAN
jgi:DNA-directed RNA polymerase specialized sigma24 family protein